MTMASRIVRSKLVVLLASGLALTACSGSDDDAATDTTEHRNNAGNGPSGTWAGELAGTDTFLAVVADGDQIVAYACDRGKTSEWFTGVANDTHLALKSKRGAVLAVSLEKQATGTLQLADRSRHEFALPRVEHAALFRAEGGDDKYGVLAGWIKLDDGSTRGAVQAGTRASGLPTTTPAPALATTVVTPAPNLPPINLTPAPMTPDTLRTPTANQRLTFKWIGAGDSFGAGEGNPVHGINNSSNPDDFSGLSWGSNASMFVPVSGVATNLVDDLFTCHRSDRAGAPKANEKMKALYGDIDFSFGFIACSGSQTQDLVIAGYDGPSTSDASMRSALRVDQPAQIDRAKVFAGNQPLDAFYMSSGGNNAGFGDLVTDCVTPFTDCTKKWAGPGGLLARKAADLPSAYDAVDAKFHAVFGTQMPNILISEYPNPMDDGTVNPGISTPACFQSDFDAHGATGVGAADDFIRTNLTEAETDFAFGAAAVISAQVDAAAVRHAWIPVTAHVDASEGHGFCTADPYFNLNSAGLKRQGHDLPALLFNISAGMLHPNDKGFNAYADAIVAKLRPIIDRKETFGLQPPINTRIATATVNGPITVRWDDRATTENAFEVEVVPADANTRSTMTFPANVTRLANGGFIQRIAGANVQSYAHQLSAKGRFTYRVRACNTNIQVYTPPTIAQCGAFGGAITGSNSVPSVPTSLAFSNGSFSQTNLNGITITGITTILNWTASADALEYVVRAAPAAAGTSGSTVDVRTPSIELALGVPTFTRTQKYSVSACNRAGCSLFSATKIPT